MRKSEKYYTDIEFIRKVEDFYCYVFSSMLTLFPLVSCLEVHCAVCFTSGLGIQQELYFLSFWIFYACYYLRTAWLLRSIIPNFWHRNQLFRGVAVRLPLFSFWGDFGNNEMYDYHLICLVTQMFRKHGWYSQVLNFWQHVSILLRYHIKHIVYKSLSNSELRLFR